MAKKKNTESKKTIEVDEIVEFKMPDGFKVAQLELIALQSNQKQYQAQLNLVNKLIQEKMNEIRSNPEYMKYLQLQQAKALSEMQTNGT